MARGKHRFHSTVLGGFLLATGSLFGTPQDARVARPISTTQSRKPLTSVRVESITGQSSLECDGLFQEGLVGTYSFSRGTEKIWERDLPLVLYRFVLKDDGSFEGMGLRRGDDNKAVLVLAAVDPAGKITERLIEVRRSLGPHSGSSPSWSDVTYCSAEDSVIHVINDVVDNRVEHQALTYRWGQRELDSQAALRMCLGPADSEPKPMGRLVSLRVTEDGRAIFVLWSLHSSVAVAPKYDELTEEMGNVISVFERSGSPVVCFAMGDAIQRMQDAHCPLDGGWPEYRGAWLMGSTEAGGAFQALRGISEVQEMVRLSVHRDERDLPHVEVKD